MSIPKITKEFENIIDIEPFIFVVYSHKTQINEMANNYGI